jgi:Fic family protein
MARVLVPRFPCRFEPGLLRNTQNRTGIRRDTPVGADFIPAPPEIVAEALEDLATFANRVDVAPVTQAAVAHAQFESIHPYPDGNGRIGRALVYRCWAYRGMTDAINPPISRVLVENRAAYIDGLTAYRDGDVDSWIDFFFEGCAIGSVVHPRIGKGARCSNGRVVGTACRHT